MGTKGIRGAITVTSNTPDSIKEATIELLSEMIKVNSIEVNSISHVIFTLTDKYARLHCGFENVAMMCFHELGVPDSLKMCLRVLIVLNCGDTFVPEFVYLKGAANLRR